jgi:hypothetical protein
MRGPRRSGSVGIARHGWSSPLVPGAHFREWVVPVVVPQSGGGTLDVVAHEVVDHGSQTGQLGDDRSERISDVGAKDKVREADLLSSPLNLLGGRRRIHGEYGE